MYRQILNRKQKQTVCIIILMMFVSAMLETMGVSMIVPLITLVIQPDVITTNEKIGQICSWLHITDSIQLTVIIIFILIVIFVGKNIFLLFFYRIQYGFVLNSRFEVQKKILNDFSKRPYEYYLDASTAGVLRVIRGDVAGAFTLLTELLGFFTEIIVCVMISLVVLIIEPLLATIIIILLLLLIAFSTFIVKPKLKRYGVECVESDTASSKWLMQFVAGIKEIKISETETYFERQYAKHAWKTTVVERKKSILSVLPRLMIESITIAGVLIFFVGRLVIRRDITGMLPQLSAFAFAAIRLLPCANRISSYINQIFYYEPQLVKTVENLNVMEKYINNDTDFYDLKRADIRPEKKIQLQSLVQLKSVTYSYPNSNTKVLDCANMEIPAGKSIGIVGTSGAGKTTAVDILLGLLEPQEGEILVDDINIHENYRGWLKLIGYIPQSIYMLDDTIRANVAFGYSRNETDESAVWEAIREAQLEEFVKTLPQGLDTTIGERGVRLSGGQRQRIGIARALYGNPDLLVFDEATSALDNETESAIMESINSLHGKKTMIIIAHRLQTIQSCDIVYRVENGKIVQEK